MPASCGPRKRRQLPEDCHGLAFERRASGKVAGQHYRESFRPAQRWRVHRPQPPPAAPAACACTKSSGRPCRQPPALCGPSWPSPVRPSPALRAQAPAVVRSCGYRPCGTPCGLGVVGGLCCALRLGSHTLGDRTELPGTTMTMRRAASRSLENMRDAGFSRSSFDNLTTPA